MISGHNKTTHKNLLLCAKHLFVAAMVVAIGLLGARG
jgi:hypothetical protein